MIDETLLQSIDVELPADKTVGIGCVGSGFIMADCHLVAYRKHGLNPVAITSRTRRNAEAVAARHSIPMVCDSVEQLCDRADVQILDVAVPPDIQADTIRKALAGNHSLRGILAQKPLGRNFAEALQIVQLCEQAGVTLAVNQNMRYDQSVRACHHLLHTGQLGDPVLATIDMRAIPHWMPWQQRQGWVTLRIMSIHHLDTFRYWLGDPDRIYASVRPDPRTSLQFEHTDGIALYILEYDSGVRASSWDDVWAGRRGRGPPATLAYAGALRGRRGWLVEQLAGLITPNAGPALWTTPQQNLRNGISLAGIPSGFRMRLSGRWRTCFEPWKPEPNRPVVAGKTWPRSRWSMRHTCPHGNTELYRRPRFPRRRRAASGFVLAHPVDARGRSVCNLQPSAATSAS